MVSKDGIKEYKHLRKQELNSSETSCDKEESCIGYFVITGMGRENQNGHSFSISGTC
jgi:hypothetical protein